MAAIEVRTWIGPSNVTGGTGLATDVVPAGAVSAAIGVEYRSDDYEYMPGATDLAKEYGSASRGITVGGYDVSEVFGEFRVPLLAGKTGVDILAIEGAIRYSDYSNFGGANTWRAGIEYGPVEWLRFRSAYNVAIRAPAASVPPARRGSSSRPRRPTAVARRVTSSTTASGAA